MLKSDSTNIIKQGRGVAVSSMAGVILYLILTLLLSYLLANEMLGEKIIYEWGGQVSLILAVVVASLLGRVVMKGKSIIISAMIAALVWLAATLISIAICDEVNIKAMLISIIICEISSFMMSILKIKKGNLHKRKHKR